MMLKDYKYELIYKTIVYEVADEPKGWESLTEEIKRSKTYHGIFRFITTELAFSYGDGRADLLKQAWDSEGYKAEVEIIIYQRNTLNNTHEEIARGKLDFQSYDENEEFIKINYIDGSVTEKFAAREEIEFPLNRTTDLDGNAYTGTEQPITVSLPPIDFYFNNNGVDGFVPRDVRRIEPTQITEYFVPYEGGTNVRKESPAFSLDLEPDNFGVIYTNNSEFEETIELTFSGDYELYLALSGVAVAWTMFNQFSIATQENELAVIITNHKFEGTGSSTITNKTFTGSFNRKEILVLPKNDVLILQMRCAVSLFGTSSRLFDNFLTLNNFSLSCRVISQSPEPESTCDIWKPIDAFNKTLKILTSKGCTSDVFQSGNKYENVMFTSGKMIRNYPQATAKVNFKDLFETYKNTLGVGLWYNQIRGEVISIDPIFEINDISFFYSNTEILDLGEVAKFKRIPNKEKAFSGIESGTEEDGDYEEIQGAFEFNLRSEHNITIPVKNTSKLRAPYNTSTIPVEVARRQQHANTGNTDTRYDDKIYLIEIDLNTLKPILGAAYDASGFEGIEKYYNINLNSRESLKRNSGLIKGLIDKIPTDNILFSSNTKDTNISYNVGNGTEFERDNITQSQMLPRLYGSNKYEFDVYVSDADWQIIKNNPHGTYPFTFNGYRYYGKIDSAKRNVSKKIAKFVMLEK